MDLSTTRQFLKEHRNKVIILFHHIALIYGLSLYNWEWPYIVMSIVSAYVCFGLFAHYAHLYFSHGKFKPTWWNIAYAYCVNSFNAIGGVLGFTVLHRHHHTWEDTPNDPHSPTQIGWWRVYLLLWKKVKTKPSKSKDIISCKPLRHLHKHALKYHFLTSAVLYAINPILMFFIISPSVVYTFHVNGLVNWLGHRDGKPRNIPEIMWLTPLSWRHGDHHRPHHH